jgi:hypothetical protein
MTFEEAAQRYRQLQYACSSGQMSWPDFEAQVEQLVVADPSGVWWKPDARTGQWLMWNGTAWTPAPQQGAPPSAAMEQPASAGWEVRPPGKWQQRIGDIITIAGSAALAYAMYYYSTLDRNAAPDKRTPMLMVAIPLLVVLRKPLDALLRPVQGVRRKIPPMVLVGFGLAIPFLVASALYPRFTQYEYLTRSYLFSTLLSYVVLRTPAAPAGPQSPEN